MVDGLVPTLGSGVFAVATILPTGDIRRWTIFAVTASKGMRPAHTPYKQLLVATIARWWTVLVDASSW
jgi:hypothetical protein